MDFSAKLLIHVFHAIFADVQFVAFTKHATDLSKPQVSLPDPDGIQNGFIKMFIFGGPFVVNCRFLGMFGDTLVDAEWGGGRCSCESVGDVQVQGQFFITRPLTSRNLGFGN